MIPDPTDTIVAIGTPPGGAARGMIRVSGPLALTCVAKCFRLRDDGISITEISRPGVFEGNLLLSDMPRVPCDLHVWPTDRSYTRQPTAELHTLGSPPLLNWTLTELCLHGCRLAQPGEFTLRAFLAGRLDLTQAEAVLGVIDSCNDESLQTALGQLAGGLSRPLSRLREQLLHALAQLEAALDFADEDINFISAQELDRHLTDSLTLVTDTIEQLTSRNFVRERLKIVLVGPPNAGKSTLFNALMLQYGDNKTARSALVSHRAGTTRDFLSGAVNLGSLECELIDTAGIDAIADHNSIAGIAQAMTQDQIRQADCLIWCADATKLKTMPFPPTGDRTITAITKIDLLSDELDLPRGGRTIACSAYEGTGMEELATAINTLLNHGVVASAVESTAARCGDSLGRAKDSLQTARELARLGMGEELIAAEIRVALYELGSVVGTVYTDDVLDRIFSQFCIGK